MSMFPQPGISIVITSAPSLFVHLVLNHFLESETSSIYDQLNRIPYFDMPAFCNQNMPSLGKIEYP